MPPLSIERKHEMLTGSELALDRATIDRSRNRDMAILAKAGLQGYKFIRLRLKNIRRRVIVGVDAIDAQEFANENMGGITDYKLEVRGGEIKFEYRPELGMYVFDLLDTERNREFLASHYAGDFWEIQDSKVNADVAKRAEVIANRLRDHRPHADGGQQEFWKEAKEAEERQIRAARGEIVIPKAVVPRENPDDPSQPILEEYKPPEPVKQAAPASKNPAFKIGPILDKAVSRETEGVGVIAP